MALDHLIEKAISGAPDEVLKSRVELKKLLDTDDLNLEYFLLLADKINKNDEILVLYDFNLKNKSDKTVFYNAGEVPQKFSECLNFIKYSQISQIKEYIAISRRVHIIRAPMHAGTGTSFKRQRYLSKIYNTSEDKVISGAKGADLFVYIDATLNTHGKRLVSLAEIQLLQAISDAKNSIYSKISIKNIVGSQTKVSIDNLFNKKSIIDDSKTYLEIFSSHAKLDLCKPLFQSTMPTLDQNNSFTVKRNAPCGHGLFAFDILRTLAEGDYASTSFDEIYRISNGEDINAGENPFLTGHIIEKKIPIVVCTTTRLKVDTKGGIIGLAVPKNKKPYVTIMELAQATSQGQEDLFKKTGIEENGNEAYFNTNIALFNLKVLQPKVKDLLQVMGRRKYLDAITPDLFLNKKEQIEPDGNIGLYRQIEGTMVSSILNLDRAYRDIYNEPLVQFINIDPFHRTEFFSPIKDPIDFVKNFFLKRCTIGSNFRLIDKKPGFLLNPVVTDPFSEDGYWKDLLNTMEAFVGSSFLDLDELVISGKIIASNTIFKKRVFIKNNIDEVFDLYSYLMGNRHKLIKIIDTKIILEDVSITIDLENLIRIEKI